MTPEEMEIHIKQLEFILENIIAGMRMGQRFIGGICVNMSLHGMSGMEEEHPASLPVPHYEFTPYIDWGRNIINLHPGNKPR
jgi:hypothetical protein